MRRFAFFILLVVLFPVKINAQTLNVAVASNFYHALVQLAPQFEQQTGIKVKISSGASGLLYAQILHGAPFDLFFSADEERPRLLEQKGLTSERKTYVHGQLALWAPQQKTTINKTFLSKYNQQLAIANPRLAPYGKAAEQTLDYLGLHQQFSTKLILGNNINQTYQFIDSGNAKAGFVAYALLLTKPKKATEYWLIPQEFHQPIVQQVVLLKNAKQKQAAQALLEYILSSPIQKQLTKMGYSNLTPAIKLDNR
ncbi:molybdate ABC transporter substrate-binding protein [Thalassotalea piscium]